MKQYENYKETQLQWAKEIPKHWSVLKIGRIFRKIGSGTTPNTNNLRYYNDGTINWLNTGDLNDGFIFSTKKKVTPLAILENSTLKTYNPESIVIALYGATIGKLGYLKTETTVNQACCVLSDSDKVTQRYLFYTLLACRKFIISKSYGGGQPNISQELIKQLYIPAPTLLEQSNIADYLDHYTSIIDTLIDEKERLIEKFKEQRLALINETVTKGLDPNAKMKDSGVSWLGDIPEHWKVIKLKYLVEHSTEKGNGDTQLKISLSNIESKTGRLIRVDLQEFEGDLKKFKKNDVLFNKLRPYLAKVLLAEEDGECVSELLVFTAYSNRITPMFLFNRLISEQFISVVDGSTYGAKMPRASVEFILNLEIAVPSIKEQELITNQIVKSSANFLKLILEQEKSILKLNHYRQSLISEAVTGKIDLKDWKAPTNK